VGYDGFESFILASVKLDSNEKSAISTDYQGLVLLTFPGEMRYPLLLDGRGLEIFLESDRAAPAFVDAPENDFLYQFLRTSVQYHTQLRLLENYLAEFSAGDAFAPEVENEFDRVNAELNALHSKLPNASFSMASVLLQARLLMESTYSVSTPEELNESKVMIRDYINTHYDLMARSDMLQEFGRQYMMMNEYVSRGKSQLKEDILKDVSDWIRLLDGRISASQVIEFFVATYFNRSMITRASEIVHEFYDIVLTDSQPMPFMLGDTLADLSITNQDGILTEQLNDWDLHKVIAIVSFESKASMAENVMLLRGITSEHLFLPVVVVSETGFSKDLCLMSQLSTAYLFYGNDAGWLEDNAGTSAEIPLFMLLDENNVVLAIARDWNIILEEELKYHD
jgi:hypothetical protein